MWNGSDMCILRVQAILIKKDTSKQRLACYAEASNPLAIEMI
jgi:hypothetical protein